jgi:hypothetical protein
LLDPMCGCRACGRRIKRRVPVHVFQFVSQDVGKTQIVRPPVVGDEDIDISA